MAVCTLWLRTCSRVEHTKAGRSAIARPNFYSTLSLCPSCQETDPAQLHLHPPPQNVFFPAHLGSTQAGPPRAWLRAAGAACPWPPQTGRWCEPHRAAPSAPAGLAMRPGGQGQVRAALLLDSCCLLPWRCRRSMHDGQRAVMPVPALCCACGWASSVPQGTSADQQQQEPEGTPSSCLEQLLHEEGVPRGERCNGQHAQHHRPVEPPHLRRGREEEHRTARLFGGRCAPRAPALMLENWHQ